MPHPIAQVLHAGITAIFTKADTLLPRMVVDCLASHLKQWANDAEVGIRWRRITQPHSTEALRSTAAQEPQKHQFRLVVGMMCQGNQTALSPACALRQKAVPHLARRHFQRDLSAFCKRLYVTPGDRAGQPQPFALRPNKPFVRTAARATQLMIQMCHNEFPFPDRRKLVEKMQKNN
jgi:hypothetical protein